MIMTSEQLAKRLAVIATMEGKTFHDQVWGQISCERQQDDVWGDNYLLKIGDKGEAKIKINSVMSGSDDGHLVNYRSFSEGDCSGLNGVVARYQQQGGV